jgi:lipopolysaccharide/colanic/teichoic acid biosynthesis glycosyltransferase
MHVGAEKTGSITVRKDNRVTRVGRILRKYKLDEIPQLINILKGEMSFVGPRPELPDLIEGFRDAYKELLSVPPGITCPSSLYFRCEEQMVPATVNPVEFHKKILIPQKIVLNQMYLEKSSVFYDIYLIALTAISCISQHAVLKFDKKCYTLLLEKFPEKAVRNVNACN